VDDFGKHIGGSNEWGYCDENCELQVSSNVLNFKNIFAKKSAKKLAFFTQNKAYISVQEYDLNIVFLEKRQFFCRKLSKFAKNCDHNIDLQVTLFLQKALRK
jgi:hypothetical protein